MYWVRFRGVPWNLPPRLLPVWNTYVSMIINKYICEHVCAARWYSERHERPIIDDYQSIEQHSHRSNDDEKSSERETSRNPSTSALFHTAEIAFITFKLKAERRYYSKRRNIGEDTDLGKWNPLAIAPLTKSHQLRAYVFQQPRYVRATALGYYQFATVSKFRSV